MNAAIKFPGPKASPRGKASPELSLAMGRALSQPWKRLLLVPVTAKGLDAFAPQLELLSGSRAFGELRVVDARGMSPEARPELHEQLEGCERAVLLVDPPRESILSTLLCVDADALILLVAADDTRLDDAREVVELCGREKFLGSLMMAGA